MTKLVSDSACELLEMRVAGQGHGRPARRHRQDQLLLIRVDEGESREVNFESCSSIGANLMNDEQALLACELSEDGATKRGTQLYLALASALIDTSGRDLHDLCVVLAVPMTDEALAGWTRYAVTCAPYMYVRRFLLRFV